MNAMLNWVVDNKEWLFSGAGFVLISWVGRLLFKKMRTSSKQTIRSGHSSNNVQAGGNIYIGTTKKSNDVE